MLDWLKNLRGKKPWQNKVGLDNESITVLAEDFDSLEKLDADLPAQVLCYLLDGTGFDVALNKLSSMQGVGEALGFGRPVHHVRSGEKNTRTRFFESLLSENAEFFVRLGKAYQAASQLPRTALRNQLPHFANQLSQQAFADPSLEWLEILLIEATRLNPHSWPRSCKSCASLTAKLVESMLKIEGYSPELLIQAAFQPTLGRFGEPPLEVVFKSMKDLAESAVRHKGELSKALKHADFQQRVYAMGMMRNCSVPVEPFLETLVELAVDPSKQVRQSAELLLSDAKTAARPQVERKVAEGSTEEKAVAVKLLWTWEGERARPFLEGRLVEEKSKKILRVIEDALAIATPGKPSALQALPELPSLPAIHSRAPLGPETEAAWQTCFQKVNTAIAKINTAQANTRHSRSINPVSADLVNKSFALLQTGASNDRILENLFHLLSQKEFSDPLAEFWQRPDLLLVHLVRFLFQIGGLRTDMANNYHVLSYGYWLEKLLPAFRRTHPEVGLRELSANFTAAGLDPKHIGKSILTNFLEVPAPLNLPPAQVWPYWSENLDLLEEAFAPPSTVGFMERYYQRRGRPNAFHALATFPQPPDRLVPLLWKLALGAKSERRLAQRCLENLPDKFERLIASLGASEADTRLAAAEWLGRIGDARATDKLLAALKREKNEATKGAMMSALALLGASVEQFLDRKALSKDAEKGVAKGVPEDLKWFPFDTVPTIHWSDDNKTLEPDIVKWWLIQGFKLKNPEPGPLLRKYCASLKQSEREALGQFVLDAWIARDTSPRRGAEAEKEAMKRAQAALQAAQQWAQWAAQNPQMAQQMGAYMPKNKTLEEHFAEILPVVLREPTGSAVSSKGILALAGACVGSGAAPVVRTYLKDWYGMRAAQCRALIQMLVWVEHKTATQLLLAVGSRFRTKSIQEEANKQVIALAERKGWTVAELADRTIPSAGLDDDGVLTLDFGPRQFTAKLNEHLEFELEDPDGKSIKALPDPRKDDDEAKATETKKYYSAAKKELKSVVSLQRDRFYEAMCTQRTWPFEDWNTYLNRHPIARHHCQRLVWAIVRDNKVVNLFRPLADGSLTDANDDPVAVKPDELVRLTHECQAKPEQSLAWRNHFKDYEVEPLFEQFGRPNFDLVEERKQEDELADFRGHLVETFKLRGRATKLGYTRGQAQDGGWFFDYQKRFPTLGINAVLEFTGNGLPEQNRTVALTSFHFDRVSPEGTGAQGDAKMSLGEVPPVLLSECWNDIRQIAAEGPGFDPEWEKKVQF
jgi:hypothetical protein